MRDAYSPASQHGGPAPWTRVYREHGRVAHLRYEEGSGGIVCQAPESPEDGREDHWLGTGSQAEYEHAARLPLCTRCFGLRETARNAATEEH